MATLDYNPKSKSKKRGEVPPGLYPFRVTFAEPKVFNSKKNPGTKLPGMTAHLDVFSPNQVIKAYENFFLTEDALWKLEKFGDCIGLPWDEENPHATEEYMNKTGQAYFTREKGNKYLVVKEFVMPKSNSSEKSSAAVPPSVSDDDILF